MWYINDARIRAVRAKGNDLVQDENSWLKGRLEKE